MLCPKQPQPSTASTGTAPKGDWLKQGEGRAINSVVLERHSRERESEADLLAPTTGEIEIRDLQLRHVPLQGSSLSEGLDA